MNRRSLSLAAFALLAATSCQVFRTGPEPVVVEDPTVQLERELDRFERILSGEEEGDLREVEAALRQLSFEYPRHARIAYANATFAYTSGDVAATQQLLSQALRLDPTLVDATLLRARVAMEEGNLPLARQVLETQVVLSPDRAELHESLGALAYLESDYEGAERALETAERLGAPAARLAFNRGLVAEAMERYEEAIAFYDAVPSESSEHARAVSRRRALAARSR